MSKESYAAPAISVLGKVHELTEQDPDKCGGSADFALPQSLSPNWGTPHCGD